jgi:hypothetical protein
MGICQTALHVSDDLSIHHQELKTAHTAMGILQTALHVLDGLSVYHHTATGICQTAAAAAV